jgi:hypothetical protein
MRSTRQGLRERAHLRLIAYRRASAHARLIEGGLPTEATEIGAAWKRTSKENIVYLGTVTLIVNLQIK